MAWITLLYFLTMCYGYDILDDDKGADVGVKWQTTDYIVSFKDKIGPKIKLKRGPRSSLGQPWPLPQDYTFDEKTLYKIDEQDLNFSSNKSCDIIDNAINRYKYFIFHHAMEDLTDNLQHMRSEKELNASEEIRKSLHNESHTISSIRVIISEPCTLFPTEASDESYELKVEEFGIYIYANEVWGALHGLETLSQLIYTREKQFYIRSCEIRDFPRFKHRGILMDTARHFMRKDTIYQVIDSMAQNKMNVLHWHIVDDQSFPYQSIVLPNLSLKGAYHPTLVYTHKDIQEVIEHARLRGVRVMPEFDTPGHAFSWGLGDPELLTQCYWNNRVLSGYKGPLDPTKEHTYDVLNKLFGEIFEQFKDKYVHLGGDEIPLECWDSNPAIRDLVYKLSRKTTYVGKEALKVYTNRFMRNLNKLAINRTVGAKYVMYEEVLDNKLNIPKDTIINVWMGLQRNINKATTAGHKIIFSTCWYLDWINYGLQWTKYYTCDPGLYTNDSNIVGGEACLWSEYITNENLISTMWPRACAVAERLWSSKGTTNMMSAGRRLQEHRCRMMRRGFNVGQANGPGYCLWVENDYKSQQNIISGSFTESFYLSRVYVADAVLQDLVLTTCLCSLIGIIIVVAIFSRKLRILNKR